MILEEFKEAFDKLKKLEKGIELKKAQILIKVIESVPGNEQLVKSINEKGLPIRVFVGTDLDVNIKYNLSWFCEVVSETRLRDQGYMIFCWYSNIHNSSEIKYNLDIFKIL